MNINELKDFIQEILNPENNACLEESREKYLSLHNEIMQMFLQATPNEKQRIIESIQEMEKLFEGKFAKVSEEMGISEKELQIALDDPKNYTSDDWNSVQRFKKSIEANRKELKNRVLGVRTAQKRTKKKKSLKNLKTFA